MRKIIVIFFAFALRCETVQATMANSNSHSEQDIEIIPGVLEEDIINTLLFAALEVQDYDQILELLKQKKYQENIIQSGLGTILLHIAANNGQLPILEQLLKVMKVHPDIRNLNGGTALILAARSGVAEAVTKLLEYKADINKRDEQGLTALSWASINGNLEIVRILLNRKADPNLTDVNLRAPLHYAVMNTSIPVIQELLNHGARVDSEDDNFQSPLKIAQQSNDVDIVDLLQANSRKWFCVNH